jgi:hypothetical protein
MLCTEQSFRELLVVAVQASAPRRVPHKPWYAGRKPTGSLNKPQHDRIFSLQRYSDQESRGAQRRSI